MSDILPLSQMLAAPPRRDRRIGVTAAVSFALHVLLIGLLLLPALQRLQQPDPPPPINVELVPPTVLSSEPPPSSEAPSSEPPPSDAPVSSEQPSMEPAPSAQPEPASSTEAAAGSSAATEGSSEAAAAASAPSEAPVPAPRPVLIPVAPDEASEAPSTEGDASTAASEAGGSSEVPEGASALTTTGAAADDVARPSAASEEASAASAEASAEQPPPPKIDGALHVARKFYLANMLQAPEMAAAREAIKKLPPQKRLVQTCNIEAIAQIGQASHDQPDAIVADAFAPTERAGTTFKVPAGAFRSNGAWHAVSYDCTLSKDMSKVQAFSFRIGGEVALPSRAPPEVKRQGG